MLRQPKGLFNNEGGALGRTARNGVHEGHSR
jgi:hypothetical protein